RLSDVCVAPDGSVMLADWYDPGVGGHGMGDWTRGRIYRVTPKGHKGYKVPELQLSTEAGLIAAFPSPCLATRALVHGVLRQQKDADRTERILEQFAIEDEKGDSGRRPDLSARAWSLTAYTSKPRSFQHAIHCMLKKQATPA